MKYFTSFVILIAISMLSSCKTEKADPQVLIDADLAFSRMSEEKGISEAFISFADSSVILLRNGMDPILGHASLVESYSSISDSTTFLTWSPEYADIAASGDLGYTWGNYFLSTYDSLGIENRQTGNYVSIWKLQTDGSWKYTLDGGTVPIPLID